ncbi:CoB--CoM heterodisulfide reductase iron-sulfur subunit A family protein [bacterium]|nr:CoB--CoM heterodisulfide reductase iron-sulfur subunit A family protein [bacterium]
MSDRCVLVVGSGVAGMRAAYDLSAAGIDVTLLEPRTYTGGTVMQLEKQFPTDACGICRMQPRINSFPQTEFCLRRDFFFPGVEVLRDTRILSIKDDDSDGRKIATLQTKGLRVDPDLCIGCGKCTEVCPVEVFDEFSAGLNKRKAIDRAAPHSIISLYSIDEENCTRCGECVKVCPTNAITIGDEKVEERKFDAVLLTPGFEEFIPDEMTEYGHGIFPDVVTSIELERIYAPMGPNFGEIRRPSDGKVPEKIAFIQCVGSRMQERPYCSSACCMYSMKEARHIKKLIPDAQIKIFFMDVRAFGKNYYHYELDTEQKGIEFVRCRVPKIYFNEESKELELVYENERGERIKDDFDMVVLSIAQVVTNSVKELAKSAGVQTDEWGFARLSEKNSLETTSRNVFAAGSFVEPKDIADAVSEASAAAAEIISKVGMPETVKNVSLRGQPPLDGRTAVVLCKCAGTISENINLDEIEEKLRAHKDIEEVVQVDALCVPDGLEQFSEFVRDASLRTVVIAACQTGTFMAKFAEAAKKYCENPPNINVVDVRRALWMVKADDVQNFIEKQILMEVAFATHGRKREFLYEPPSGKKSLKKAVIIGGGVAGLSAAEVFAHNGIPVVIVEKEDNIGGVNRDGIGLLKNSTIGEYISSTIEKLKDADVEILTSSRVVKISGSAGAFDVVVQTADENEYRKIQAGTVIAATGAVAHTTEKFSCDKSPNILLWDEFERNILTKENFGEVVFIQCADSRNEQRPWCNRICCNKTMELSKKIFDKNPDARIWILNRDIMTYGLNELDYLNVRERGALFLKYTPESEPVVEVQEDGQLLVKAYDPLLDADVLIHPDYVVLQTGLNPSGDDVIAQFIPSTDGFWNGLDVKFSPQETDRAGFFVAGSGRMPMRAIEAILDGRAAAAQAMKYLVVEQFQHRGRIAYVREKICVGCQYCVSACPYDARVFDYYTRKVSVISELCQGCGACAVACPSEATVILEADRNKIFAEIMEAVR